jgi:hypothetical protein
MPLFEIMTITAVSLLLSVLTLGGQAEGAKKPVVPLVKRDPIKILLGFGKQ